MKFYSKIIIEIYFLIPLLASYHRLSLEWINTIHTDCQRRECDRQCRVALSLVDSQVGLQREHALWELVCEVDTAGFVVFSVRRRIII